MRRVVFAIAFLASSFAAVIGPTVAAQDQATPPVASPGVPAALVEVVAVISISTDFTGTSSGVAVANDGTLYVIDSLKDHIRVFDGNGDQIAIWGESGDGPGQFRFTTDAGYWGDLAIGPDGNLYVADTFNDRIQVLAPDGTAIREWGESGTREGQFDEPTGIGIDASGHVYVADGGNGRVQVFDSKGEFLAAWDGAGAVGGPFNEPADVVIDAAGIVSVSDYENHRVYRFTADGTFLSTIGEIGYEPGQFTHPWGLAVDGRGNLYVADYLLGRVQIIAPDNSVLGTFGTYGGEPGELVNPIYLTIGPDGMVYVADEGNLRVQVFRLLDPLEPMAATPVP